LVEGAGVVAPAGQHYALRVEDLDAARQHLGSHGVEVSEPKQIGEICVQSFFKDPTGNLIELTQPL